MATLTEISLLLTNVKSLVNKFEQYEQLRGDRFNIFSVLKMENKENSTHSAFLAELLKPDGSHGMGEVFLKLFLEGLNLESHIESSSTKVKAEYFIGNVDIENKTGGRIDICVIDASGNTVSIENKIYAGDQILQIERYCNYNKEKNIVLYLTLDGREPSQESKGILKVEIDYRIISYKDHIVPWLKLCVKESADSPLLRESIRQYINLINKMASTLDNQFEQELNNLLIAHYETGLYVKNNLNKARLQIADKIRTAVFEQLKERLSNEFEMEVGDSINKIYAQIWIWHKGHPNAWLFFGIESFNGTGNDGGNLFVGVFNSKQEENSYTKLFPDQKPKHWYEGHSFEFEGGKINFGNDNLIVKILNEVGFKEKLIDHITRTAEEFISIHKTIVLKHLQGQII